MTSEVMGNVKISIVTITYNNYSELVETLNSVPKMDGLESCVINGGTCEQTKSYLNNEFKGIHISEPDDGIADAFNKGVKLSNGHFVMFLNSGDKLIQPDYIRTLLKDFQNKSNLKIIAAGINYVCPLRGEIKILPDIRKLQKPWRVMPFPHPGLIVNRQLFNKYGLFDQTFKIGMDLDWVTRATRNMSLEEITTSETCIVEMDGTGISSQNKFQSLREIARVMRKNNLSPVHGKIYHCYHTSRVVAYYGLSYLKKIFNLK